jgi:hypothetical protein
MTKFDELPRLECRSQAGKSYLVVLENMEETAFFRADQITSVEMMQFAVDDRKETVRGSDISLADGRRLIVRDHPGWILLLAMKS